MKDEIVGKLYLKNENEYRKHINNLKKKYGNKIPYEELYKFVFDWKIKYTNANKANY